MDVQGNNGGDGIVAARHLVHFGFKVSLLVPKLKQDFQVILYIKTVNLLALDSAM